MRDPRSTGGGRDSAVGSMHESWTRINRDLLRGAWRASHSICWAPLQWAGNDGDSGDGRVQRDRSGRRWIGVSVADEHQLLVAKQHYKRE